MVVGLGVCGVCNYVVKKLFRKHVMFRGNSNPDQLNEIMKHFGSEEI